MGPLPWRRCTKKLWTHSLRCYKLIHFQPSVTQWHQIRKIGWGDQTPWHSFQTSARQFTALRFIDKYPKKKYFREPYYSCLTVKGTPRVVKRATAIQSDAQLFFTYLENTLSAESEAIQQTSSQSYVRLTHDIRPIQLFGANLFTCNAYRSDFLDSEVLLCVLNKSIKNKTCSPLPLMQLFFVTITFGHNDH